MVLNNKWILRSIAILSLLWIPTEQADMEMLVDYLFPTIIQYERESFQQPPDDFSNKSIFDFIVVGGGTAGCTVASRLSEISSWDVLVLEAGPEETFAMDMPYFVGTSIPVSDWGYTYVPQPNGGCPGGPNATCPYPRGKVLGGSSSVNYMLFMRGNKRDYDHWEELGNTGWNYDNVLKYFKKMEDIQIPSLQNSFYHGKGGNIKNSAVYETMFTNLSFAAAEELDIPIVDYNGANQTGISSIQSTTYQGLRWSANRGYLYPARRRPNLTVRMRCLVSKILMRNNRAVGVEYIREGKTYSVYAKKEVIVSAGAINSPQLLMVSGIGPREHLQKFNIPVIQDLPVGRRLIDHSMFLGLVMTVNESISLSRTEVTTDLMKYAEYFFERKGPLNSMRGLETFLFSEVGTEATSQSWTNMEHFVFTQVSTAGDLFFKSFGFTDDANDNFFKPLSDLNAFLPILVLLRPRSTGVVNLTSNSIADPPLIDPKFFSNDSDVEDLLLAIRKTIRFFQSGPFRDMDAQVYNTSFPSCSNYEFNTDEYWKCTIRWASSTVYHPCGTCRMGPQNDTNSVVTPNLQVKGIQCLRVVDASVMPEIPAAHLQVPTYMIAEKASDIIKASWARTSGILTNVG